LTGSQAGILVRFGPISACLSQLHWHQSTGHAVGRPFGFGRVEASLEVAIHVDHAPLLALEDRVGKAGLVHAALQAGHQLDLLGEHWASETPQKATTAIACPNRNARFADRLFTGPRVSV
jgi:hypothetical protein